MKAKPIVLKENNVSKYLLSYKSKYNISKVINIKEVKENTGSCWIFKIIAIINGKEKAIVLKQARDYLKIDPSVKGTPKRIKWEHRALVYFSSIVGKESVPEVLWFDELNYVLVMSDIMGKKGKLLRNELNKGNMHKEIMNHFATLLAKWHLSTYGTSKDINIRGEKEFTKEWRKCLLNEGINAFYTVGARKIAIGSIIDELLEESRKSKKAIIWMDPLPKNMIVGNGPLKLIDFETVVKWDIAWDPAIFISDWIVKLAENGKNSKDAKEGVRIFLIRYLELISKKINKKELKKIKKRIYRYIGVFLLHRTNGLDNYQFKEEVYRRIQEEALRLIQGLYANDFAKDLIKLLDIDKNFVQKEISFKSLGKNLKGILQIPISKKKKKIPVVMFLHGATDRGMLGTPAIYEISKTMLENDIAFFRFNFFGTGTSDGLLSQKDWKTFEKNFQDALNLLVKDKRFSEIGIVGRSVGAVLIGTNINNPKIRVAVLHNLVFDMWYDLINNGPKESVRFIKGGMKKYFDWGRKTKEYEYIKGDIKFNPKLINDFYMEKWKIMKNLPMSKNLLIMQAEKDSESNPQYAEMLYNMTNKPKKLVIIPETNHKFKDMEKEAAKITCDWLLRFLDKKKK